MLLCVVVHLASVATYLASFALDICWRRRYPGSLLCPCCSFSAFLGFYGHFLVRAAELKRAWRSRDVDDGVISSLLVHSDIA